MDLNSLRAEYDTDGLTADDLGDDPIAAVAVWLEAAAAVGVPQANAMAVASVDHEGRPSVRTVLLKDIDRGFVFYTNYSSRKGRELAANPWAAASLTWVDLHRQIRIEGSVERTSSGTSDRYFASRPRGAQIAAAISQQSDVIGDRSELAARFEAADREWVGEITRPSHWGGFRIVPDSIEFWQGRRNRLHDRILFTRNGEQWSTSRLSP